MAELRVKKYLQMNRFNPKDGIDHIRSKGWDGQMKNLFALNFRIKDRLLPYQQLVKQDQLISNNNRVNLSMQENGNLAIYRSHFGRVLWSSNTAFPVDRTVMQKDGNLVAQSHEGTGFWSTATPRHPGAWLALQDDGNLVVYDSTNQPLWASNTVQDFLSPIFQYTDSDGYSYIETSEYQKDMCQGLPCFAALQWPNYATKVVETNINGQAVVIQLWKGWCQQFGGVLNTPGGIGAEVGVYRRMPGKPRPASIPFISDSIEKFILDAINILGDDAVWWPYPELNVNLEYSLINPETNETFFTAGPEKSYWLAKWMSEASYLHYKKSHKIPTFSANYILEYKINGQSHRWK